MSTRRDDVGYGGEERDERASSKLSTALPSASSKQGSSGDDGSSIVGGAKVVWRTGQRHLVEQLVATTTFFPSLNNLEEGGYRNTTDYKSQSQLCKRRAQGLAQSVCSSTTVMPNLRMEGRPSLCRRASAESWACGRKAMRCEAIEWGAGAPFGEALSEQLACEAIARGGDAG